MGYDANDILGNYVQTEELVARSTLSPEDISKVNFTDNSGDILVEALKTLVNAYSKKDNPTTIIRKINMKIESMSGSEE